MAKPAELIKKLRAERARLADRGYRFHALYNAVEHILEGLIAVEDLLNERERTIRGE